MRIQRIVIAALFAGCLVALPIRIIANGKPEAGCPRGDGWILSTLEDAGIDPDIASGIPSLDGNGDGWTCYRLQPLGNGFFAQLFRDNNVRE